MTKAVFAFLLVLSVPSVVRSQERPAFATPQSREVLQPGDLVRLWIWREPDMTGEFPVGEDGTVVFPKIGSRNVTQTPPSALKARLLQEYGVYLRNPSIEVLFLRRVSVSGEVEKPGLYHLDPTQSVADALVLAGGVTERGRDDVVQLRRNGTVILANLRQGDRIADSPIQSGDQLYVPQQRWLSRNPGTIGTIISAGIGLATTLLVLLITK